MTLKARGEGVEMAMGIRNFNLRKSQFRKREKLFELVLKPLNTELNPICHLLAFLGAHHILHISRIRVNIYTHTRAPFPHSHSIFLFFLFNSVKKAILKYKKIWERHLPPLASSNYAYVYYIGRCWALCMQF